MKIILKLACFVFCFSNVCAIETIKSPDGQISLSFDLKDIAGLKSRPVYNVSFKGKPVIAESGLGFDLSDGSTLDDLFEMLSMNTTSQNNTWKPLYGERSVIRDNYNQLTVKLRHKKNSSYSIELQFRCYNSGVAFQYTIGRNDTNDISIKSEKTEFRFLGNHVTWVTASAQGIYEETTISKMKSEAERPLTIRVDKNTYVAIAEAKLVDYARMRLVCSKDLPFCIICRLGSPVQSSQPLKTPWRVILIAESPGQLLENNDIILNLNDPCEIEDTSWIKPGKIIREVTLTTIGGKACVDFAVKHNLQYVEFDAGWYGYEYSDDSDARTVTVDPGRSPGPLDLHEVIRYADERGIGIILYVNRGALEGQLDEILPLYKNWGIKGVKYGFVQVGSQKWTSWLHKAVREAAKYQLMVDIHDEYRPTGYSRTYPNLMTQEGIRGDEAKPPNEQTLMTLFTRMLAGAGDNTICYYDSRVETNASHAYQLAKAVCFYSPWQFIYWYDRPKDSPRKSGKAGGQQRVIGDEPESEFFDNVPTVWDDTKVIHGSIGEYAIFARRSNKNWFIGGMNSGIARTLNVPLTFLSPQKEYVAFIYSDDSQVDTPTHVRIERFLVNSKTILEISMIAKGGQAVRIVPAKSGENYSPYND